MAAGETITAVFTITVADGHGGSDTQDVTITITGANDAPVISIGNVNGAIIEGSGDLNETGSISFTDVDLTDRPTATEATKSVTGFKADNTKELLLTNEQKTAIENAFTIARPATNTNNGKATWDYTITEGALDFLAAGEHITAVFTITIADDHGGTDTQEVTITITGANDAPVITNGTVDGAIIEGSGDLKGPGSISFTDVDLTDRPTATEATKSVTGLKADNTTLILTGAQATAIANAFTISPAGGNANSGTITWDYTITEGELDFLAAGETVTAVFTVNVNDGHGDTASEDVTIKITGTNDDPVITVIDVSGDITEDSVLTDAGSVTFEDVDLTDRPTATEATKSVTGLKADNTTELLLTNDQKTAIENAFTIATPATNTNNGEVNWDYTITEGELDFLAAGETVTAVFTVNVNDGHGATDTQDVTITITGANDTPVISIGTVNGAIIEGSGDVNETGSISFTDVDLTDRPTAKEATKSVTALKADNSTLILTGAQATAIANAFTISPAGGNANNGEVNWDYTITEGELDFLAAGETITAVFTITVADGHGGTDTQDITITISGANDAPVITGSRCER